MADPMIRTLPISIGGDCWASIGNKPVKLTLVQPLGDGREGKVFLARSQTGEQYAAKLYYLEHLADLGRDLIAEKLQILCALRDQFETSDSRGPFFAWPLGRAHLADTLKKMNASNLCGYVMRVAVPRKSLQAVVDAAKTTGAPDLNQRLAIVFYIVKGFEAIHRSRNISLGDKYVTVSLVAGDVNESNIEVVEKNLMPYFFDCDSFIVKFDDRCLNHYTYWEQYSSPEFLERTEAEYCRSASDDLFGMAVIIFRLLNNWHRPYLYVNNSGHGIKDIILDRRFPYARGSKDRVVRHAEQALQAYRKNMPPSIQSLFERTFIPSGPRPEAAEWVAVVGEHLKRQLEPRPTAISTPNPPRGQATPAPDPPIQKPPPHILRTKKVKSGSRGWAFTILVAVVLLVALLLATFWYH